MNYFEVLGVERRLALEEEEIKEAFHAKSREEHPDVAGGGAGFDAVNDAYRVLSDPLRRLKHWLELEFPERGEESGRELISGELLELFGEVGRILGRVDEVLKKKAACQTSLGRAMLAGEETAAQQELSRLGMQLGGEMEGAMEQFEELEGLIASDRDRAVAAGKELARRMSYLAKWIEQVRAKFAAFI